MKIRLMFICLILLTLSCHVPTDSQSGQPYVPYITNQVVVDHITSLQDGASVSWKLEPGSYKLELTANNDGAIAEWIGGSCPATKPMRTMTVTCNMSGTGQLVISNPTTFGLGKDVNVTVKLTRLSQ